MSGPGEVFLEASPLSGEAADLQVPSTPKISNIISHKPVPDPLNPKFKAFKISRKTAIIIFRGGIETPLFRTQEVKIHHIMTFGAKIQQLFILGIFDPEWPPRGYKNGCNFLMRPNFDSGCDFSDSGGRNTPYRNFWGKNSTTFCLYIFYQR